MDGAYPIKAIANWREAANGAHFFVMDKLKAASIKALEAEDKKLDSNDRSFTERMAGKRKRDRHVTTEAV